MIPTKEFFLITSLLLLCRTVIGQKCHISMCVGDTESVDASEWLSLKNAVNEFRNFMTTTNPDMSALIYSHDILLRHRCYPRRASQSRTCFLRIFNNRRNVDKSSRVDKCIETVSTQNRFYLNTMSSDRYDMIVVTDSTPSDMVKTKAQFDELKSKKFVMHCFVVEPAGSATVEAVYQNLCHYVYSVEQFDLLWGAIQLNTKKFCKEPPVEDRSVCIGDDLSINNGYKPHDELCDRRIKCFFADNNIQHTIEICGCSEFWDENAAQCQHASTVNCQNDICSSKAIDRYPTPGNCRGFWTCDRQNGRSERSYCCNDQEKFDVNQQICILDLDNSCKDVCSCPLLTTTTTTTTTTSTTTTTTTTTPTTTTTSTTTPTTTTSDMSGGTLSEWCAGVELENGNKCCFDTHIWPESQECPTCAGMPYGPEQKCCQNNYIWPINSKCDCNKDPFQGDISQYIKWLPLPGFRRGIVMSCPPSKRYDEILCDCTTMVDTDMSTESPCAPDFDLDFTEVPFKDQANNAHLQKNAFRLHKDAFGKRYGRFDGSALLSSPRFNNYDWPEPFGVRIVFNGENNDNSDVVLLSNHGCAGVRGSLEIRLEGGASNPQVVAQIVTSVGPYSAAVPYQRNEINDIRLSVFYGNMELTARYEDGTLSKTPTLTHGSTKRNVNCNLEIGCAGHSKYYIGQMTRVTVYTGCAPDDFHQ